MMRLRDRSTRYSGTDQMIAGPGIGNAAVCRALFLEPAI